MLVSVDFQIIWLFAMILGSFTPIFGTVLYDSAKRDCVHSLLSVGKDRFCSSAASEKKCIDFFDYICEYKPDVGFCEKISRPLFVKDLCAASRDGPKSCSSEFSDNCPSSGLPKGPCSQMLRDGRDVFCASFSVHEECWEVFNEYCALTDDEKMAKPAERSKEEEASKSSSEKPRRSKANRSKKDSEEKSSSKSAEKLGVKDENMLECCKAQGVAEKCMPLCSYNPDFDIVCNSDCLTDVKKTIYCASNEENNLDCCKKDKTLGKKESEICLIFCEGKAPPLAEMFKDFGSLIEYQPCTSALGTVIDCHKENAPEEAQWKTKEWEEETISDEIKGVMESFGNCAEKRKAAAAAPPKSKSASKESEEKLEKSESTESDSSKKASSSKTSSSSKKTSSTGNKSESKTNSGSSKSSKSSKTGNTDTKSSKTQSTSKKSSQKSKVDEKTGDSSSKKSSKGSKKEGSGSKKLSRKELSDLKNEHVLECCKAQNVPNTCLDLCSYSPKFDFCKMECYSELKKAVYCAANTQDNSDCCKEKPLYQENDHCLPMCKGESPSLDEMFGDLNAMLKYKACTSGFNWMMGCHKKGSPAESLWEKRNNWRKETLKESSASILKSVGDCKK